MKIFIVMENYDYEGASANSVWDTKTAAEKIVDQLERENTQNSRFYTIQEMEIRHEA